MNKVSETNQENSIAFGGTTFGFSGSNINDLTSSEYTLVGISIDRSYSIQPFVKELQETLKEVVRSCQKSPRSDNLLIRIVAFDSSVEEVHGFKELNKCDINQYDKIFNKLGNATALYDSCVNNIEAINKYGQELSDNDYDVNSIFICITDGLNNHSSETMQSVKTALNAAVGEKKLESLLSILVGVNTADAGVGLELARFAKDAMFSNFIEIEKASAKELAKLAQFISKSISSQSQALNTGSAGTVASLQF